MIKLYWGKVGTSCCLPSLSYLPGAAASSPAFLSSCPRSVLITAPAVSVWPELSFFLAWSSIKYLDHLIKLLHQKLDMWNFNRGQLLIWDWCHIFSPRLEEARKYSAKCYFCSAKSLPGKKTSPKLCLHGRWCVWQDKPVQGLLDTLPCPTQWPCSKSWAMHLIAEAHSNNTEEILRHWKIFLMWIN